MKKFFALFFAVVLAFGISFVSADAVSNASALANPVSIGSLKISNEAFYSPYPVEPGRYFDLYVRVQNPPNYPSAYSNSITSLDGVVCKIDDTYPFSIDSSESREKLIGSLGAGQEASLKFKVRVADDAVGGSNDLPIKCKYGGMDWNSVKLSVYVQARDALLSVSTISIDPQGAFVPGEQKTLGITLENTANTVLRDITVKVDLGNDLPFAAFGSTNEQRIVLLEPGQVLDVNFLVKAFSTAESKMYKIPISISYYDDLGKSYSRSMTTSLEVFSSASILTNLDSTEIKKAATRGKVVVSLFNRGLTTSKFTTVYVLPSTDFELFSSKTFYLGNINSDDSNSVNLDLFVLNTTKKSIFIPLRIEYFDELNNRVVKDEQIEIKLYGQDELLKYGIETPSELPLIVWGVVAIVGLYLLFKLVTWIIGKFSKKK